MIHNNFDTTSLSVSFPFISSDLTDNKGVLYGINRHNNSLILFDRFNLENANMVVFAKSGSGKSECHPVILRRIKLEFVFLDQVVGKFTDVLWDRIVLVQKIERTRQCI